MDNPGDAKYGMTTEQLFEAFRVLKAKGAKRFGIHAFLASNTVTNEYYPMLAKVLFELAVKLEKETGADIQFINLSGGVGIPYRPDQEPNDIRVIGAGVKEVYDEVLVPAGMGDVAIYTEMGRFMTGEKLTLLVLHKGVATLTGFLIKHVVAHSTVTSPSSQTVTCIPVLTYFRNSSPRLSTTGILPSVHTSPEMASLTANGFLS